MDSKQFFEELFGNMIGDGILMYVWSPKAGSTFFSDIDEAATYVEAIRGGKDVYFGLGGTKHLLQQNKRPTNLQVGAIPGFWLDLDIADPAHKKENLPRTRDDVLDLLEKNLPLKPSILVNSGHGLHAYWLFKEPWIFETEDERVQAASLLQRFVLSFKYHAAVRGWALDSVFDLARVLRVPGTMNCKTRPEVRCEVIESNDVRYNPEDFEPFFAQDTEATNNDSICELLSKEKNPLGLFLRPTAAPPHALMETLKMVEPKFEATWNKNRPDLKEQSLSVYEMSLTSLCVSYGWKNQDIADLIVAFRRRHGKTAKEVNKGMRVDYLTRTILKAREKQPEPQIDSCVLELAEQSRLAKANPEGPPPPDKDQIRTALEGVLRVKIDKIIRYTSEPPTFEIRLADGAIIPIGTVDKLITQRYLKNTLAGHSGVIVRAVKGPAWDEYCNLMMELVESVRVLEEDSTERGILSGTITQYLARMGVMDDKNAAAHANRPFWEKGRVWLFSKAFVHWTKINDEPVTLKDFSKTAKELGIKTETIHFKLGTDDKPLPTTRSCYDVTVFMSGSCTSQQECMSLSDPVEPQLEIFQ